MDKLVFDIFLSLVLILLGGYLYLRSHKLYILTYLSINWYAPPSPCPPQKKKILLKERCKIVKTFSICNRPVLTCMHCRNSLFKTLSSLYLTCHNYLTRVWNIIQLMSDLRVSSHTKSRSSEWLSYFTGNFSGEVLGHVPVRITPSMLALHPLLRPTTRNYRVSPAMPSLMILCHWPIPACKYLSSS